jgi:hypothetical protein
MRQKASAVVVPVAAAALSIYAAQPQAGETVAAAQAFFSPTQERVILDLCRAAMATSDVFAAFAHGALPHMTLGSWIVTPDSVGTIVAQARAATAAVTQVSLMVTLKAEPAMRAGYLDYQFIPEATPEVLDFHRAIHTAMAVSNQPHRRIDLPGSWQPHISLFTAPVAASNALASVVRQLGDIRTLDVQRLGVVHFQNGINTKLDAPLPPSAAATPPTNP